MSGKSFIQHNVENKQLKGENEKLKENENKKLEMRKQKLNTRKEKLQMRMNNFLKITQLKKNQKR